MTVTALPPSVHHADRVKRDIRRIRDPARMAHTIGLALAAAVYPTILAGVIAQILVQPPGALADVPDWLRYGAVAAGFAMFMLTRRSIFAGVVCGEAAMVAGKWWLG